MSTVSIRNLIEAGTHFGHRRRFWNPSMEEYIHSTHHKVDIINVAKTRNALHSACEYLSEITSRGGRVLFIGTKRAARDIIKEQATAAGMPYINHRWLGGTLTNWKTIRGCISKLEQLEKEVETAGQDMSKKELLGYNKTIQKLSVNLEGIRNIGGLPTVLYVVDVRYESIAVAEAHKMGIPVVAMVDTNSSPDHVTHLIPANDDAKESISIITKAVAAACKEGADQVGAKRKGSGTSETIEGVEVIRDSSA